MYSGSVIPAEMSLFGPSLRSPTSPPYLLGIRTRAAALDVPTPVVDALINLLAALNTPTPTGQPLPPLTPLHLRLLPLFAVFSDKRVLGCMRPCAAHLQRQGERAPRVASTRTRRSCSSCSPTPCAGWRLRSPCSPLAEDQLGGGGGEDADAGAGAGTRVGEKQSPFDGLTATWRACVRCGYTAAVRHFAFDRAWRGEEKVVQEETAQGEERRAVAAAQGRAEIGGAGETGAGGIEEEELEGEWDLDGEDGGEGGRWKEKEKEKGKLKIEQLAGGVCTQQSVLGRPPTVLALHLNCFMHTGFGASKNTLRAAFPELLDLTPYTTNGVLSGSLNAPVAFRAPPRTYTPPPVAGCCMPPQSLPHAFQAPAHAQQQQQQQRPMEFKRSVSAMGVYHALKCLLGVYNSSTSLIKTQRAECELLD
ncbi:hypothetical protein B0H14DRAFT_3560858 [Mycena olivaceomarginata]|nr:hypothetical protein B0H14DRAFT_3560858 [Mycena olivaceomarginata]